MLKLFTAPTFTELADSFIKDIQYPDDPLQPVWIIVQNKEVQQWLNHKFADQSKIAANLKFILPSQFIWDLYRIKDKNLPSELPSDKNAMVWGIHRILTENRIEVPFFKDTPESRYRLDLSIQVADVFDLYQNYRPQMMEAWLNNKDLPEQHAWQASLWNELVSDWNSNDHTKLKPRRSKALLDISEWIGSGIISDKIPENIYVFGLSMLNRVLLDLFQDLSKITKLNVYLTQYEETYSGLDPDIIQRWVKAKNDQLNLLRAQEPIEHHSLKKDEGQTKSEPSISVHSCHGPEREAEVLKDEILRSLDDDTELQLDDILIMVPDAEIYGPLIDGILKDPKRGAAIDTGSEGIHKRSSPTDSLQLLLGILRSDYKSGWIQDLFRDLNIRRKFNFSDDDISRLENWVQSNRVFYGLGDSFNTPYSWRKGATQLLLGYAMLTDDAVTVEDSVPFEKINSGSEIKLASRFSEIVRKLKNHEQIVSKSRNVTNWLNWVRSLLSDFIETSEEEITVINKLLDEIDKLMNLATYHDPDLKISYSDFRFWFLKQLDGQKAGMGKYGSGITVSTYIPYRSIPFKWIGILGMNEQTFPRRDIRPEFDLIQLEPQAGDRIQKEDDMLWFLDMIYATGNKLHISYEGKDQKNDKLKLPSILIQQLLDEADHIDFISHSLHPYSLSNFSDDGSASYDAYSLNILSAINSGIDPPVFLQTDIIPQHNQPEEVHYKEIINFFQNPAKYYLQKVLSLDHYERSEDFRDKEFFKISGLDKYLLEQQMFQLKSKGIEDDQMISYMIKTDQVTDDLFGHSFIEERSEVINELIQSISTMQKGEERAVEIDLDIAGINITGSIAGIFGNKLLSYRVGSANSKLKTEHWIKYLILSAFDKEIDGSSIIYKESKKDAVSIIDFEPVHNSTLVSLVQWFKKIYKASDLNFFPYSSFTYAEDIFKGKEQINALKRARSKFTDNSWTTTDMEDFHIHTLWAGKEPLSDPSFKTNAEKFWIPFMEALDD